MQPNIFKCESRGLYLIPCSYGEKLAIVLLGCLFWRYVAMSSAYRPQKPHQYNWK